jgi:alpha,alpha-trehalase
METITAEAQKLKKRWSELDAMIRDCWEDDLQRAQENELRDPSRNVVWYTDEEHRKMEAKNAGRDSGTLLFLPYPYITGGGSESSFPEMYAWDTFFVNQALLLHGRSDIVRNHIFNQLFLIERFGMVLNGNRTYYLTRSQTPLLAESIRRYHQAVADRDLLAMAYPLLKREYQKYWTAPHHQTPTGLATNADLGDPWLRPELAAEAECLDFTAVFDGDIRKCNPIQTNAALVKYARALEWMALELNWPDEAHVWGLMAEDRAEKMRKLNWDSEQTFFLEYQFEKGARLPYQSLSAYWTMWAGVATKVQASYLVKNLRRFEQEHGLTHTDRAYPSPHPEFSWVQWGYPCGWPPDHMIVVEALDQYGFHEEAGRIASLYLNTMIKEYGRSGKFWEKSNVVEGNVDLPRERTPVVPLHGWTTAAFAWLGRRVFEPDSLVISRGEEA